MKPTLQERIDNAKASHLFGEELPAVHEPLLPLTVSEAEQLQALIEAAKISAELAPRVPDGNKLGHDWTIPNPVIAPLVALDKP